ncbi:MAG: hypothetical protein GQ529_11065, partial [Methyloprofundus sp.]|nr:hypothetical protein [Methyloprofundus sp.]
LLKYLPAVFYRIAFLTGEGPGFTIAVNDPQQDFYGLTIPLSAPFAISESGLNQIYESPSAHLLSPGQPFNFTAKRKCNFLVANFFADPVSDYSRKLLQSDSREFPSLGSDVSFLTQTGSVLLRSIAKIWSAFNNRIPATKITLTELEDDLLASFILYSNENTKLRK